MNWISDVPLGKKNVVTDPTKLGQCGLMVDKDYSLRTPKTLLTHIPICVQLVRNESGGNLTAGTIVRWSSDTTYGPGRAAGVAAVSGTSVGVGVIDPYVTGNIAAGETFWLIRKGPCKFKFTTGTTLAIDDKLALGASGRVVKLDHTSLTDQLIFDRCGVSLAAVDTAIANDTLFRGICCFFE